MTDAEAGCIEALEARVAVVAQAMAVVLERLAAGGEELRACREALDIGDAAALERATQALQDRRSRRMRGAVGRRCRAERRGAR